MLHFDKGVKFLPHGCENQSQVSFGQSSFTLSLYLESESGAIKKGERGQDMLAKLSNFYQPKPLIIARAEIF